jgi:NADH-quinone oxidoreductase subunit N
MNNLDSNAIRSFFTISEHQENLFYSLIDLLKLSNIESYFLINYLYFNNYIALYFELFLILSFSLLIAFLVIIDAIYKHKIILIIVVRNLFIFILLLSLILLNNVTSNFCIFDFLIIQDNLGLFIKNILIFILIGCTLISSFYINLEKIIYYEYFFLLSLSFIGMLTICSANDLTTLYLGIELQSLAFYLLAAFKIYNNFSTEAGLKYFILGAFSSGLLLFGCSLIYGFTGTTNLLELKLLFFDNKISFNILNGILLGNIFITVGILFKLGAAPFHM